MRFIAHFPMPATGGPAPEELAESLGAFAQAAEAAGFDGLALTEHPAPSGKWLAGGGHSSFDPYVAFAYCAALTERIRFVTHLSVLPYRPPLVTAKAAFSTDVLSKGRLTITCGAGYLRSEFAAVGANIEERSRLTDEALEVISAVWANPAEYSGEGLHWLAKGVAMSPGPVQKRAPLWIGGNGRAAMRRVAQHGTGWAPMIAPQMVATTTGSRAITNLTELKPALDELREVVEAAGRDFSTLDICTSSASGGLDADTLDATAITADIEEHAAAGITWMIYSPVASTPEREAAALTRFGAEVMGA
jgi:probable F420-dependent oxidoreductase